MHLSYPILPKITPQFTHITLLIPIKFYLTNKIALKRVQTLTKIRFTTKQLMFRANNLPMPWKFTQAALGMLMAFCMSEHTLHWFSSSLSFLIFLLKLSSSICSSISFNVNHGSSWNLLFACTCEGVGAGAVCNLQCPVCSVLPLTSPLDRCG